jgi:hypothetical protein
MSASCIETLHHGNERRIAARNPTEPQTAANLQKYTKIIKNYHIPRRNQKKLGSGVHF